MLDCISRRSPRRRLPGRDADGHELLLRPDPGADPRQVRRGPRADHAGVGRGRAVRLRRQVQPAALRQLLAEADPAAAPADLHPGRRLDRDVGLLPRQRLQLLVPLVRRVPRRQEAARRVLGAGRRRGTRTTRRTAPRSRRSSAWPTPTPRPSGSTPSTSSTSSTAACTSTRASPTRPATARSRRSRPACSTSSAPKNALNFSELTWKDLVDGGYVIAGSPETVLDRMKDMITTAAPRARVLPDAQRQHAGLEDALLDEAVRREGDAAPANMWPDYDGDDRWWIHPLEDRRARRRDDGRRAPRRADPDRRAERVAGDDVSTIDT